MSKKFVFIPVLTLLAVLMFSMSGAASTTPQSGGNTPQEFQLTEQNNGQAVDINGEVLVLNLESNPSTGYGWQVQGLDTGGAHRYCALPPSAGGMPP
jgi:hypothetical protein